MAETLSLKERLQYTKDVLKARQDPIWFLKDKLEWTSIWPKQEEIIRTFYRHKYDPSQPELKELAWISGQRSGKSVTVGNLGAYEFFEIASLDDPAAHYGLMRKQPIAISCIAAGKEQAIDGIYTLLSTALEESEWVQQWWGDKLKFSDSGGRIDFREKNIFVQVKAARADTGAGYTSKCVIFDELDLFQKNTESKISAENVFRKLVNSTMTLGEKGKVMSISSLDNVDGMMSRVYYEACQKKNAIAYNLKTWEVNPRDEVKEARLREEFKYDMESFHKYFENRPDISSGLLFAGGVKLNKEMTNVLETDDPLAIEEAQNHYHALCVDPGHRNDAFGLSIGYREGNNIVIDGTMKFEKEGEDAYIKPSDIENSMNDIFDTFNVTTMLYDIDTILFMVEKAENRGIQTIKHIAGGEAYGLWWNLNEGKDPNFNLNIVYNEYLRREAEQLQKQKTAQTGKLRIDHPYKGSKDMSDTVANLIWYLYYNEMANVRLPVSYITTMRM